MTKRYVIVCSLCVSGLLTPGFLGRVKAAGTGTDPTSQPLVQSSDISYVGGFRLPASSTNGDGFEFGGGSLGFNPIGNSLFVASRRGNIAEINIPTPVSSNAVTDMPFAQYIQPFADPTEGHLSEIGSGANIDGLLVFGGKLVGTGWIYYDALYTQRLSHYYRSLNLSQPSFQGMYIVGDPAKAGYVAGYMATVPAEWQSLLGGPAVTGQCCIPIVTRTSWGPSAFAWNPSDLGNVSPVPATPLLYYTGAHQTLGSWEESDGTYGGTTDIGGMAIVAGTRTALYIGRNGTGPFCYGNGTGDLALAGTSAADGESYCYDPTSSDKGQHAYPYNYQIWAYDLNDLAAVKAGQKQPWDVVPYGVWPLSFPTSESAVRIGGVAYDAARQLLYVTQMFGDHDGYAYRPVVHTLKIAFPGTTTSGGETTITAPAQLTTPAPGSTLMTSTAQFQWTAGTGVSQYSLSVGTTAGGAQLYSQAQGMGLSTTVSGLPSDGSTVYVRIASLINGNWQSSDSIYRATTTATALAAGAEMVAPAPGSTLTASTVQFQWRGTGDVSLYVGTTPGAGDLYSADLTSQGATVTNLPTNGSIVYVRLFSLTNGTWRRNDFTYTAATPNTGAAASATTAQLTNPAPGSSLNASTVQFQWSGGSAISQYWLYVGATTGGKELYNQNLGANISATVSGLPANGGAIYVRLWFLVGATWDYRDYSYTATTAIATLSSAAARLASPPPGSVLTGSTATFQWVGGTPSQYWLTVGTTAGGNQLYNHDQGMNFGVNVAGLPTDGSTVYVRLSALVGGTWQWADYTYTAATTITTATSNSTAVVLAAPQPGSRLTGSTAQFGWFGSTPLQYWLSIGTTRGGTDLYNQNQGMNFGVNVAGLPTNGSTVYVRLSFLVGGVWQWNDYAYVAR